MSIYAKFTGIKGSVTAKNYTDTLAIGNYYLKASRGISQQTGIGNNRTIGTVKHQAIVLNKLLDEASTALLQHFYQAKVIPTVIFYHVTAGMPEQCYLTHTFKQVMITRFEESNHETTCFEELEMIFTAHEKRATILNQSNRLGTPKVVAFDMTTA